MKWLSRAVQLLEPGLLTGLAPHLARPADGDLSDLSQLRHQSFIEGLEQGRSEMQQRLQDAEQRLRDAVVVLARVGERLDEISATQLGLGVTDVARLVYALTEQLVGAARASQLALDPQRLQAVLQLAPDEGPRTLVVSPSDAAALAGTLPAGWDLSIDPQMLPGDCVLRVEHARIDGCIDSAMERLRAALSAEPA